MPAVTRLFPFFALLVVAGGAGPVPDHSRLDAILGAVVRGEQVDYRLLGNRYRLELFNYLAKMAMVDPAQLRPQDRLAFYINLYNATMLHEVVQRRDHHPAWRPDADGFAVFKERVVTMSGRKLSLDELEHGMIRPQFQDPRIHAAVVCAARSCPPLLPRAYRGDDLDEVLDANMKRFVNDRTRNPIDDARKQLRLSRIFDWYAGDFGGREKLAEYVGTLTGKDYGDYTVSFVEYSWELNDTER